jgi:hypothetical protein
MEMEQKIPLVEALRAEATRLAAAAGGEGNNSPIFDQIRRVEEAFQFLLAVANWASDKVASPERLNHRLKELGLK